MFGGSTSSLTTVLADTWEYEAVDPASYEPFGAGCAGSAGTPKLRRRKPTRPWLGDLLEVEITNLPPGAPSWIFLGFSNAKWGTTTLPFALGWFGMQGCSLLVRPDLDFPLQNPNGTALWSVPIPNDRTLLARSFFNQSIHLDPPANARGLTLSNGGEGVIGAR